MHRPLAPRPHVKVSQLPLAFANTSCYNCLNHTTPERIMSLCLRARLWWGKKCFGSSLGLSVVRVSKARIIRGLRDLVRPPNNSQILGAPPGCEMRCVIPFLPYYPTWPSLPPFLPPSPSLAMPSSLSFVLVVVLLQPRPSSRRSRRHGRPSGGPRRPAFRAERAHARAGARDAPPNHEQGVRS